MTRREASIKANVRKCAAFILCAASAIPLRAQTVTTLFNFDGSDGYWPHANLVRAAGGELFGATLQGGANNGGTIFKVTPDGVLTTIYSFCAQVECADGKSPNGTLVQANNGDLFGTTNLGGIGPYGGEGTVFKVSPGGTLTTLHNFCPQGNCADGANPSAGLVQATNGDFYGTTLWGGGSNCASLCGTVFKITPSGTLTTLYKFCSQTGAGGGCTDGMNPFAVLIQARSGDFYGTTGYGGANDQPSGGGTIFKLTPTGTLTTLYSFCAKSGCRDGETPLAGLLQATDGDFYGTTMYGGAYGHGTIFKITSNGSFTSLYSFCSVSGCPDGEDPAAGLIQATDGEFYGTTYYGGSNACAGGCGTVFKITPRGAITTLYSFGPHNGTVDGAGPYASLVQAPNGDFYGTTQEGGPANDGTVFRLSVAFGAFVDR